MKSLLTDRVRLAPHEIAKDFDAKVINTLRTRVEGKCTRHGYIKPGSVDVIKIAPGALRMISLNGDVIYTVYYKALVCNPQVGSIVEARVTNTNKFGILAEVIVDINGTKTTVLDIIVAKQGSIRSDVDVNSVQLNKTYNMEIMGKKYELNDKKISAIGRIVKSSRSSHGGNIGNDQDDDTVVHDDSGSDNDDDDDEDEDDDGDNDTEDEPLEGGADASEQEKESTYEESEVSEFEVADDEELLEDDEIDADIDDDDADVDVDADVDADVDDSI